MLLNHTDPGQSINNVYELPNIEQSIKYLHACAGFPKKGNMAQSHWISKLYHMARINYQIHKQVFHRSRGNPERKHVTDKARSNINKIKDTGPPTCSIGNNNKLTPKEA